jgi:hypothetical protein
MKLTGRVPVEPLDDERWTQIERRVVAGAADAAARPQRLRDARRLGRIEAVVAIAAAGLLGWALRGSPDVSRALVADAAPIAVAMDAEHSRLDLGDAVIHSDPATAFVVTRPDGGVLVALSRGKVELEVGKRGARPPLVVRAGDTDVVVVGTRFTVDYGDGRGEVDVQVLEGVVSVIHERRATRVAAGEAWHTRSERVASADVTRSAAGRSTDAGDAVAATPDALDERIAGNEPAPATDRHAPDRVAVPNAPGVLRNHTAALPDAPAVPLPPAPAAPSRIAAPTRTPGAGRPSARVAAAAPVLDLKAAIRAQRVEPALNLAAPNAASALARYYDIAAHRSGDEASQAFYSIAVVQHLRLAHDADALATLDAYTHRFPGGKEYRAVLWLRVRILCLERFDDRCRAAAYTYLHEAPEGPGARVAERVTLTE